jgi:hypothetical protein
MSEDRVRGERLRRTGLLGPASTSISDSVRHLTAVQAQEFDDVCRAMSHRIAGAPALTDVADQIATGDVVRHHVLRPTWHLVHVSDLDGLLDLTASRIHAQLRSQYRKSGILDDLARLVALVGEVVEAAAEPVTRKEIGLALAARGEAVPSAGLLHLTLAAELDKVITTSGRRGTWDTFVPYRSRIPVGEPRDRDEAIAALAQRYLTSHAPASEHDFAWWAGLTLTDAKRAFERVTIEPVEPTSATGTTLLLSLFDEYVIAYADRSIYSAPTVRGGTIDVWGGNLVMLDGISVGTWRVTKPKRTADMARLEITAPLAVRDRLAAEIERLKNLTPADLVWKDVA